MKRDKNLIPLSRQHHHGLIMAQLIKKDTPEYRDLPTESEGKRKYVLKEWKDKLVPHFKLEEEILFPKVKDCGILEDEIDELIDQHRQIESLVEQLSDQKDVEEKLDQLGHLLEKHIRMEEREVFQKIQEQLPKDQLDQIGHMLGESN